VSRLVALGVLAALMALARWGHIEELTGLGHQATLSLGFVLIFGFLVGHFAKQLSLPGITGYILAGILCGPYVGRLLTPTVVEQLRLIDDLALALIAFAAGGELRIRSLAPRLRSIVAINATQTVLVFSGLGAGAAALYLLTPFIDAPSIPLISLAIVFGLLGVANSPATAVAIINEYRARGPLTDTVLGVTVLKDVVILILITVLLPLVRVLSEPGSVFDLGFVLDLSVVIGASLMGGVALGLLVTLYMRGVGAVLSLFIVGVGVLATLTARQFHLEPLLLCMVAGFVIENATKMGDRFIQAIDRSVLPVYVVFFAIGGASLDLGAVRATWVISLSLVTLRLILLSAATAVGEATARGGNEPVRRWGWMGFVAQAGVTLGLASIVERSFPGWGTQVKTIALAMIAVNQLLGPVAFRWALMKSGEAHRAGAPGRAGASPPRRAV
jgi:Kef-type K+ transport system membrane component KefB